MTPPINNTVNPTEVYNWYEDLEPAAAIARTQATDLPDYDSVTLEKLPITLSTRDEYDDWERAIRAALKIHKLTDLLDINIIRPKRTDKKGQTWYRFSLAVAEWLKLNISEEVNKLIHQTDSRMVFADEIFQALREHMEGMGTYANMKKWERWDNIMATDYESKVKYVEDVLIATARLADSGIVIPPYGVLMKILNGLAVHDRKIIKDVLQDMKLRKVEPSNMTMDYLNFTISNIQQYLLFRETILIKIAIMQRLKTPLDNH
ncbi:hypothetical protein N7540_010759 [Penicillium herquei]|nr:hypothetical protein N7540_010759 [Penicillium herquei]